MPCAPDKFLIDRNAGRLVKWLRALGFDAEFADDGDDGDLVRRALREGRAVVTKDRKLLERRVFTQGEILVVPIAADELDGQLRDFFSRVHPDLGRSFTRCIRCNAPLCSVAKEDVRAEVPPYVYAHHDEFSRCPQCRRIYWRGTHWEHMDQVFREAVADG